jgi:hypothetical protein
MAYSLLRRLNGVKQGSYQPDTNEKFVDQSGYAAAVNKGDMSGTGAGVISLLS